MHRIREDRGSPESHPLLTGAPASARAPVSCSDGAWGAAQALLANERAGAVQAPASASGCVGCIRVGPLSGPVLGFPKGQPPIS